MKKVLPIILCLGFVFPLVMLSWAQSPPEATVLFFKGNEFYKQGQYTEAIEAYEEILQKGWASGPLYYNMGNSYFKKGALGQAILNYTRAKEISPRDADIKANLDYVSSLMNKNFSVRSGVWQHLEDDFMDFYTLDEMSVIILTLFFLIVCVHLISLYQQWPVFRCRVCLFLLLLGLIVFVYGLGLKWDKEQREAIMIATTVAKYEPLDNSTIYFEIPQGLSVKIIKEEKGWVKIEREDGKLGWVKRETVEKI